VSVCLPEDELKQLNSNLGTSIASSFQICSVVQLLLATPQDKRIAAPFLCATLYNDIVSSYHLFLQLPVHSQEQGSTGLNEIMIATEY
jgi:hypothetical protein